MLPWLCLPTLLILTAPSLMHFLFLYFTHSALLPIPSFLIKNLVFFLFLVLLIRAQKVNKNIWWRGFLPHSPFFLYYFFIFILSFSQREKEKRGKITRRSWVHERRKRNFLPLFMHQFLWIITNFIWRHSRFSEGFLCKMCAHIEQFTFMAHVHFAKWKILSSSLLTFLFHLENEE